MTSRTNCSLCFLHFQDDGEEEEDIPDFIIRDDDDDNNDNNPLSLEMSGDDSVKQSMERVDSSVDMVVSQIFKGIVATFEETSQVLPFKV
jgi:hypothetical protein